MTVTQQHIDRIPIKLRAFSLAKMLSHNAAAYNPTSMQLRQTDLLATIEGLIMRDFFKPVGDAVVGDVTSRGDARRPSVYQDGFRVDNRKVHCAVRALKWRKHLMLEAARGRKRKSSRNGSLAHRNIFRKRQSIVPRRSTRKKASAEP